MMSAISQLVDMEIPKTRARAALKRTKDDVMSAAERIFAGEFDDVPSDDEDEEDAIGAVSAGNGKASGSRVQEDSEDYEMDDHESMNEEYDAPEHGEKSDNTMADPYANVFFSKDRTETIIEPIPDDRSIDGNEVRILDRAEWMKGCPEGNEQSFLFQHYTYLESGNLACAGGCGESYERQASDFFALTPDFQSFEKHLEANVHWDCPKCEQVMCLACGEKVQSGTKGKKPVGAGQKSSMGSTNKLLHCPNLQGVSIGMGLYMIDQTFCRPASDASPAATPDSPPHKRLRQQSEISSGASTPTGAGRGIGYAGHGDEDTSGQQAAAAAQAKIDEATTKVLKQVQVYLPNLDRSGGPCISDHMVHPTALAHLRRRSAFVNDLLRNESLLDMSSREELYLALFDWLKVVSSHESLASMLAMPQMRAVKAELDEKNPTCKIVTYEGASSPRELLENCVIQAKAALKSLQQPPKSISTQKEQLNEKRELLEALKRTKEEQIKVFKTEAEKQASEQDKELLRVFCQRIVDAAAAIDRSLIDVKGQSFVKKMRDDLPKIPDMGEHVIQTKQAGTSAEAVKKIYEEWATKARFQYCDMTNDDGSFKHRYDPQIRVWAGQGHRGRVRAIAQEMGMLSTNLPVSWDSSIFVRVDSTRPDCLKAMIIGPQGTPYENGCFVFDIHLPHSYNTVAPNVSSMTTNGGKYRYNPNLYADGKVCLSLLGTWAGPGWISGKSTLLQVLISIQSLILCDEPYLNEPGWSSQGGSDESKKYSANVRRMVIKDAMANNIETPPFPFENEIKTHFRLKKDSIIAQLDAWKAIDNGHDIASEGTYSGRNTSVSTGAKNAFDEAGDRLRALLDTLDAE